MVWRGRLGSRWAGSCNDFAKAGPVESGTGVVFCQRPVARIGVLVRENSEEVATSIDKVPGLLPVIVLDSIWEGEFDHIYLPDYVKARCTTMSFPEKVRYHTLSVVDRRSFVVID
eukprot:scaffold149_cov179-Amphora_coffeaeformis.AAC.2